MTNILPLMWRAEKANPKTKGIGAVAKGKLKRIHPSWSVLRTAVGGCPVLDFIDSDGKLWTTPTDFEVCRMILVALSKSVPTEDWLIEFVFEGTLKSRYGKPYRAYSGTITDGQGIVLVNEKVLKSDWAREKVASGKETLEDMVKAESQLREGTKAWNDAATSRPAPPDNLDDPFFEEADSAGN